MSFSIIFFFIILTSVYTLRQSQEENIKVFKEEFIELTRELFDNNSNLFFYNVNNAIDTEKSVDKNAEVVLNSIKKIDPQGQNAIVINIAGQQFLYGKNRPEFGDLINEVSINKILEENLLTQKREFNFDNFNDFLKDSSNTVLPVQINLHIYKEANLIVGYSKTFTTGKVRIQFVQKQNQDLLTSYVRLSLFVIVSTILAVLLLMIFFMRNLIINPLKKIAGGLEQVRNGNLEAKISIDRKDELGQLAVAFNQMTSDLKKTRQEIQDYNTNLEKKIEDRTKELNERAFEAERMNKLIMGRELKMVELKERIKELEAQLAEIN